MKATITHTCGHEETHQIDGPQKLRQGRIDWLAGTLCHECYIAERDAERAKANQAATDANAEAGLPALQGSPKQIAWAETIRATGLESIDELMAHNTNLSADQTATVERATTGLKAEISAGWWIEHQKEDGKSLLRHFARKQ